MLITPDETDRLQEQSPDDVAWRIGDRTEYALEGSIFIAGAVVQWCATDWASSVVSKSKLWPAVDDTGA